MLAPLAAYSSIKARVASSQLTVDVHPLMQWLRGFLQDTPPGLKTLVALDLEDRPTSGRWRLLQDLVPEALPLQAAQINYIMQVPPAGPLPQTPVKKEVTPEEIWEQQKISLFAGCTMPSKSATCPGSGEELLHSKNKGKEWP